MRKPSKNVSREEYDNLNKQYGLHFLAVQDLFNGKAQYVGRQGSIKGWGSRLDGASGGLFIWQEKGCVVQVTYLDECDLSLQRCGVLSPEMVNLRILVEHCKIERQHILDRQAAA